MSKPLELTVYPFQSGHYPYGYLVPTLMMSGRTLNVLHTEDAVDKASKAKHLTEAELAAEFESARCDSMIQSQTGRCWQPLGYTWPMDAESIHDRAQTLLRFATSPHYCEDDV